MYIHIRDDKRQYLRHVRDLRAEAGDDERQAEAEHRLQSDAGTSSNHRHVSGSPLISTIGTHHQQRIQQPQQRHNVTDTGSTARGNCSARTSPRLPVIAREPAISERVQNENTKTPTDKNAMKLGTPRFVCSSNPKIR